MGSADDGKIKSPDKTTNNATNGDYVSGIDTVGLNPPELSFKSSTNQTENQPEHSSTQNEKSGDEKETFEVSKGFMQLGIEGFMDGGKHDVRRPHMPEKLAVFKPATEDEKTNKNIQKYKKDANDRFKKASSGAYIRSVKKSIYDESAYSATYPKEHVLGTYPNNSGLTIGYGYDLGNRKKEDVEKRLVNAGFPKSEAASISEAAGLKGVKAGEKTAKLRNTGMMITQEQALKLLDLTIPEYEEGIDMDKFHPAVTEVMVYLNYWRGYDGAKKYNKVIKDACDGKTEAAQIKATRDALKAYTGGSKKEKSWTEQVFTRFVKILSELVEQQDAGKEIIVSENVKTKDQLLEESDQTGELLTDSVGVKLDDHLRKQRLLKMNVGFGAPNEKADVDKVMSRLVIAKIISPDEYAGVMESMDEKTIGEYVKKYQLTFWKNADGIVEVGGGTEQRLIALKAPEVDKPKETPEETPDDDLEGPAELHDMYSNGDIDMIAFSKMLKPYCSSDSENVIAVFGKLWWYERDNLAFSITKQSTDSELADFALSVLERMSSELGGRFNTGNREENLKAKERVDAILEVKQTPEKSPEKGEDEKDKEKKEEDNEYVIHDPKAYIRDSDGNLKEDSPLISKWTKVTLLETKEVVPTGKKNKITIGKVSYEMNGGKVENWTSMVNLYAQFWNPEDHKDQYTKDGGEDYADVMTRVDPETSRAATIMSGSGVKAVVDQFFPNSTKIEDLGSTFGGNLQDFSDFLSENGMTCSITAGLRHPLRSMVFDSAIKASSGKEDLLQIAQAQSIRYGLPIDWIHYKPDGNIDLAKSKAQAKVVKKEFSLGSRAARGVKDELGGKLSKHNLGNAVDMNISFDFKEKVVEKNGNSYTINAAAETPTSTSDGSAYLKDCGTKPLAQLGKNEFNVTRILDDDAIHWSPTGR